MISITASQHHSITASQHHSITASQHHSITASQHHSITASQHQSIAASTLFFMDRTEWPGANPTILSYNASAVKIYNTMSSLVRFGNKKIFSNLKNDLVHYNAGVLGPRRHCRILYRVARWFISNPNIQILVNFGGPWNGKCWYMYVGSLLQFGIYYAHWENFMSIWYWSFGIFLPILVYCITKNLATLIRYPVKTRLFLAAKT
jgi:hypothetical protein